MMLAQWLRLDTPPHAVVATGLPLLTGGPRRLAHGVFSTLTKREAALPDAPTLPAEVAARWGERAPAIAAGLAEPPPLDLALRDAGETAHWTNQLSGDSMAPGHIRLPRGANVEKLPGFKDGAWWVQDLAASLPSRLLGPERGSRCSTSAPRPVANHCNWRRLAGRSPRSTSASGGWNCCATISSVPG